MDRPDAISTASTRPLPSVSNRSNSMSSKPASSSGDASGSPYAAMALSMSVWNRTRSSMLSAALPSSSSETTSVASTAPRPVLRRSASKPGNASASPPMAAAPAPAPMLATAWPAGLEYHARNSSNERRWSWLRSTSAKHRCAVTDASSCAVTLCSANTAGDVSWMTENTARRYCCISSIEMYPSPFVSSGTRAV